MNRSRAIAVCVCALAVSAYAASAAAAEVGTTAYTCKAGLSGFSTEHCVPGQTGTSFGHESIPESTTTELLGTSDKTNAETNGGTTAKLRSVQSGVEMEIQAKKWDIEGEITAGLGILGPYVHVVIRIKYTEAEVAKPAGKGCVVKGGEIISNELKASTLEQGMGIKFEPKEGTVLASFEVSGCSVSALNGLYKLEGSFVGTPNGATVEFSETGITTQGTLKLRGQKAGFEGKTTLSARANSTQAYTPISFTTTEK